MKRATPLLLLSLALHGALVWALWPAPPQTETPRLGLKTVSVRLLPNPMNLAGAAADGASMPSTLLTAASGKSGSGEQRATQPDDWLPSGRLTRLPLPLEPLDFGAELAAGFAGRVELILLVDRSGKVREVSTRDTNAGARAFAQALSPRIRHTRFSPGEVNGVPVNAIVKIAVVSEAPAPQVTSAPPSSI
jgi:hypothetical protein